jgi:hypothetical protein
MSVRTPYVSSERWGAGHNKRLGRTAMKGDAPCPATQPSAAAHRRSFLVPKIDTWPHRRTASSAALCVRCIYHTRTVTIMTTAISAFGKPYFAPSVASSYTRRV